MLKIDIPHYITNTYEKDLDDYEILCLFDGYVFSSFAINDASKLYTNSIVNIENKAFFSFNVISKEHIIYNMYYTNRLIKLLKELHSFASIDRLVKLFINEKLFLQKTKNLQHLILLKGREAFVFLKGNKKLKIAMQNININIDKIDRENTAKALLYQVIAIL